MHMVRHYHYAMHIKFSSMIMQAMPEDQTSYRLRKHPSFVRGKRDIDRFALYLQVGEIPPIISLGGFCQPTGNFQRDRSGFGRVLHIYKISASTMPVKAGPLKSVNYNNSGENH